MSDDLIERLRGYGDGNNDLMDAAADRIEKLEAALAKIAQHDMQAIAIDALHPGERIREGKDD